MLRPDRVGAGKGCSSSCNASNPRAAATRERQPLDRTVEQFIRLLRAGEQRSGEPRATARRRVRAPVPTTRTDRRQAPRHAGAARSRRGRTGRGAPARAWPGRPQAAAASTCTRPPGRRGPHRGTGSSSLRAGTEPGRAPGPATRATETMPSSSGCRNASRVGRWNSGSSSSSRTPWCARLASPGTRAGAASDDRGGRGAVMRRPERAVGDQWAFRRKHAGDRVDPHHLERLPRLERRQDRRQAPAEHRLPGARWPGKQQVVAAGGRELERAPRPLLPANVGQVWMVGLGRLVRRLCRRRPQLSAEVGDRLGEMAHGDRLDAAELRLARRLGCAENPLEAGAPRTFRDGERAAHRPDATVESELADGCVLGEPLDRKLARCRQHRERDREVEAGALLAQPGRGKVDRDPLQRPLELRRPDAAANAVLGLRARPVGETRRSRSRGGRRRCAPRPRRAAARGRRGRG